MVKTNNLKKLKDYAIYMICILSFFTAFLYNEINLKQLPDECKRENQTVITNDDASYLNPALNYLKNKVWCEDYWGAKVGYFLRPPGYGLLHLSLLTFFDLPLALSFLKFLQLVLFAVSVYWLFYISLSALKNRNLSLLLAALYGLSPFAVGFLFYTLTEGITPAILLGFVFYLYKGYNAEVPVKRNLFYLISSLFFSYLFIIRPVLGIFGLLLPIFLIKENWKNGLKVTIIRVICFGVVALSLMTVWQVRNYKIAGKYVGLHPIYFEDVNTVFRLPFREYWNFAGGWAEKGDNGFSYMMPIWEAGITGDTSINYVNDAIDNFPERVTEYFGRGRLTSVLKKYQESILVQKTYYDKELPMPMEQPPIEKQATEGFMQLTSEFKSHFWFDYYIKSPLKVFKLMTFHSNLSLYIFQRTYRGTFIMETLRLIFYSIHGLCFLLLGINLFLLRRDILPYFTVVIIPLAYVFYLCFVQRGIEERYTLPVLPFLMIGLFYTGNYFWNLLKKQIAKKQLN